MSHSDQALLDHAITQANIPTLLMVLVQMTGDTHWLDAPYQINRQSGMGDNDSGGLDATLQADREAGGLELLTRLQWRGEPGTDETLQQLRDVVAALVPNDSMLSLRDKAAELVAA